MLKGDISTDKQKTVVIDASIFANELYKDSAMSIAMGFSIALFIEPQEYDALVELLDNVPSDFYIIKEIDDFNMFCVKKQIVVFTNAERLHLFNSNATVITTNVNRIKQLTKNQLPVSSGENDEL